MTGLGIQATCSACQTVLSEASLTLERCVICGHELDRKPAIAPEATLSPSTTSDYDIDRYIESQIGESPELFTPASTEITEATRASIAPPIVSEAREIPLGHIEEWMDAQIAQELANSLSPERPLNKSAQSEERPPAPNKRPQSFNDPPSPPPTKTEKSALDRLRSTPKITPLPEQSELLLRDLQAELEPTKQVSKSQDKNRLTTLLRKIDDLDKLSTDSDKAKLNLQAPAISVTSNGTLTSDIQPTKHEAQPTVKSAGEPLDSLLASIDSPADPRVSLPKMKPGVARKIKPREAALPEAQSQEEHPNKIDPNLFTDLENPDGSLKENPDTLGHYKSEDIIKPEVGDDKPNLEKEFTQDKNDTYIAGALAKTNTEKYKESIVTPEKIESIREKIAKIPYTDPEVKTKSKAKLKPKPKSTQEPERNRITTASAKINRGKKKESILYIRGVLSNRPYRFKIGAFFCIAWFISLPLIAAGIIWGLYYSTMPVETNKYVIIALPSLFIVLFMLYLITAQNAKCDVCGSKQFIAKGNNKHKKAAKWPLFGTLLPTALHAFFLHWYRCRDCGTAVRLKD